MSFIPVLSYILGLGVFGFMYWLLDGILNIFIDVGIHETGTVYTLMILVWGGVLFVYIIFRGLWLLKTYNENENVGF